MRSMIQSWVAVWEDGREWIYGGKPIRSTRWRVGFWELGPHNMEFYKGSLELPKGSIKKLIGRELTWDDEPVELIEEQI